MNTPVRRSVWAVVLAFVLCAALAGTPPAPVSAVTTRHVTDCTDGGGANTPRSLVAASATGDIVYDQDCTGGITTTLNSALGAIQIRNKQLTISANGDTVMVTVSAPTGTGITINPAPSGRPSGQTVGGGTTPNPAPTGR